MDLDERGFGPVGDAGGAMRFVAHGQVEAGHAVLFLRVDDRLDGLVRGEHDVQAAAGQQRFRRFDLLRQPLGVGRGREVHVQDGFVRVAAGGGSGGVGTYGVALDRFHGLPHPRAERLGNQGDRRGEEQDAERAAGLGRLLLVAPAHKFLGQAQGGEGLAGAARHDQFAAVVLLESFDAGGDGLLLVVARRILLPFGRSGQELRPVRPLGLEIVQAKQPTSVAFDFARHVGGEVGRGRRDDQMPVADAPAGRVGEKRVQLPFAQLLVAPGVLALDGPRLVVVAAPANEVDPVVLGGTVRVERVGFAPQPYVGQDAGPFRFMRQEVFRRLFERRSSRALPPPLSMSARFSIASSTSLKLIMETSPPSPLPTEGIIGPMGLNIPSKPWAEKPAARVLWLSGYGKPGRAAGANQHARPGFQAVWARVRRAGVHQPMAMTPMHRRMTAMMARIVRMPMTIHSHAPIL